jgi:RimJ/RimL family protein N-acetyltransferase
MTSELRTERLLLRQWRDEDLDVWAAMNADPEVRKFFPDLLTREQAAASLDYFRAKLAQRGWGWWAVEVTATGEFIGMAGLDPVDEGLPFRGVEAGWRLVRTAWGKGYATEAARGSRVRVRDAPPVGDSRHRGRRQRPLARRDAPARDVPRPG